MNKILIVDDNLNSGRLAQYIVNLFKMESEMVSDGEEALYYLINESPETLILDLSMPKLGGLDTMLLADQILNQIHNSSHGHKMRVIFYTSTPYENLVFPKSKHFKVIGYVSKDWTVDFQKRRFRQLLATKGAA